MPISICVCESFYTCRLQLFSPLSKSNLIRLDNIKPVYNNTADTVGILVKVTDSYLADVNQPTGHILYQTTGEPAQNCIYLSMLSIFIAGDQF